MRDEALGTEFLAIKQLGSPKVSLEGRASRFGTKKALALLCYLAADGRKRSRSELAELLWPKSDQRTARTDLRTTLSRLRKPLGKDELVAKGSSEGVGLFVVEGELLGLEPRGVGLHLRTLGGAVSLARSETSELSPGGRSVNATVEHRDLLARLEGTLEVYRGEFTEGFSLKDAPEFELWLEAQRAWWRGVFGELCERVSRLQIEVGRLEEAIGTARLWTRHAPLEERYPDLPSPTSGEGETAKVALFEAIARMVAALASHTPMVLFLDDLQWADASTLEVLDYAARRWVERGAPVLVLITARPEEVEGSSAFERWVSSIGRRLYVRSLVLGPQGTEDVVGLLRRLARAGSSKPGHRRALEVLEESGAPAAELARHALAGGLAQPAFGYLVAAGDQAMEVFAARRCCNASLVGCGVGQRYKKGGDPLSEGFDRGSLIVGAPQAVTFLSTEQRHA